ncbi:glycosyltransferase family 4 protein [Candidatus Cardinium hertigii]|nr:glycosyltransferase family 4 protein [Candidatus Cardinium hertigii]
MQPWGILFFADRLPPLIGGMEIHAKYFIEYFDNHHKFHILGIVTKNAIGQNCVILKGNNRLIQLDTLADLFCPSFLFFNSGRWIETFAQLRNGFPKAKFIYRTGGNEILKADLVSKKKSSYLARRIYWVDTLNDTIDILLTNSIYTETRLRAMGITAPFQCFIGGVHTAALKATKALHPKRLTIFCAARFVPYKHHAIMVDVAYELVLRGYSFTLRLAGDGPLLEKIKRQVAAYKLTNVIKFLGVLDHAQICQEMVEASIYMQLSSDHLTKVPGGSYMHAEGMGRSILEALTAGTFVIAGQGGALSEIVVPPYGLLVDIADFHTMVDQVEAILNTPLVKRPIGDTFCWSKVFKGYETLFDGMG